MLPCPLQAAHQHFGFSGWKIQIPISMDFAKQETSQSGPIRPVNLPPLRCIVKLGGSAITCKYEIEKINEENLRTVSSHLRQAMITANSATKVVGMDWSKGLGNSKIPTADDFEENSMLNLSNFIIVHGAGSFGHFQASRSGVHKGGLHLPLVKAGFVATRISVTSLNLEIVRALAREGIPSVGMSPFACGWSTCARNIAHADIYQVSSALDSGFVPVLHGDAVLDESLGCTILSGDLIIRHLAQLLSPKYVVFLVSTVPMRTHVWFMTDVLGVYDRPPEEPSAVLLREIAVDEEGNWSVVNPKLDTNKQVEITVAEHDTTGGMVTKISEAAMIAKLGIDVYIVKAGTSHSLRALAGEITSYITDDWLGTAIRFSKRSHATD